MNNLLLPRHKEPPSNQQMLLLDSAGESRPRDFFPGQLYESTTYRVTIGRIFANEKGANN